MNVIKMDFGQVSYNGYKMRYLPFHDLIIPDRGYKHGE